MFNSKPLKISPNAFKGGRFFKRIMKKMFGVPSPKELGKSDSNALPMQDFLTDEQEEEGAYTWTDWQEEMQAKYPIRYFLSEDVPHWFAVKITMRIEHWWRWFKHNTYKKYHLLDLRQPHTDTADDYRYGWCDQKQQVLYAPFNALVSYCKEAEEGEYFYSVSDNIENNKKSIENIEKEILAIIDGDFSDPEELIQTRKHYEKELHVFSEIQALYDYWTVDRKESLRKADRLLHDWSEQKRKKGALTSQLWTELNKHEEDFEKEETEMLIRLIKIRSYMWN